MSDNLNTGPALTREITALSDYVALAGTTELPREVSEKTKAHILDTVAAMISGARLNPGEVALDFVSREDGTGRSAVVGSPLRVPLVSACFANGMLAHSDETDDSHADSLTHPGCAIVPTALAFAADRKSSGAELVRAVAAGYEIGTRINIALVPRKLFERGHGPHPVGGQWGAAAAAAVLCGFDAAQVRCLFSYVAQQTSGTANWMLDEDHILKAYVFAGMPARDAGFAAEMVAAGFTGILDVFQGRGNFLSVFADEAHPEKLWEGLGERHAVMRAAIKKFPVGSPIQAALESLLALMEGRDWTNEDIASIACRIPSNAVHVVDDQHMPNINLQHCLALTLTDGKLDFDSCHDEARMLDPKILAVKAQVELIPDEELRVAVPDRQAIVTIGLKDGRELTHRTRAVRGTPDNQMDADEVIAKARELILPSFGAERTETLLGTLMGLEGLADCSALDRVLS